MNKIQLFKSYSRPLSSLFVNRCLSSKSNDVDSLREIESNLFENSSNEEPTKLSKKELLKQYVKGVNNPKFEKKLITPKVNSPPKISPKVLKTPVITENDKFTDDLDYVKLRKDDPMIGNLILTATSKQYREKNEHIVLEGARLIQDAIDYGLELQTLLFSRLDDPAFRMIVKSLELLKGSDVGRTQSNYKLIKITYSDMKIWSQLTTTPGLMGIFRKPTTSEIKQNLSCTPKPITIVCDNIREPQNLGSIIRVSAAVAANEVLLLKGCTDPWSTKSLRSGCGGQFRVLINSLPFRDDENLLKCLLMQKRREDFSIFLADNKASQDQGKTTSLDSLSVPKNKHIFLVIGGETHGIDPDYHNLLNHDLGDAVVNIPLENNVESLNSSSALAVLLYEIRRQLVT